MLLKGSAFNQRGYLDLHSKVWFCSCVVGNSVSYSLVLLLTEVYTEIKWGEKSMIKKCGVGISINYTNCLK